MNNSIQKVFNLEGDSSPAPQSPNTSVIAASTPGDETMNDDFDISRKDFDDLIEKGKIALDEMMMIAQQGQHPRFYEAIALMIKTLGDINSSRMDLHEKVNRIKKIQSDIGTLQVPTTKIDKAIFVGSTADLLKHVKPRDVDKQKTVDIEYTEDTQ